MRYNKVLFVIPRCDAEWRGLRPHIGLGYLGEFLESSGVTYDVLDMNLGHKMNSLVKKMDRFKPDLVGMPLISVQYLGYYKLLSELKGLYPQVALAVGGPHVTILQERVLADCPAIDYGVTYEGEFPLLEICKGEKPLKDISNVIYRNSGDDSVHYTGTGPPLKDLDQLPLPTYEKFELDKYVPEVTIYSSRGCPYECIFCPNRLISPHYRPRSARHVVDEMEYWYAKGMRQFNFDDDNFNLVKERVYEICDELQRRGMNDLFLRCANGIRADRVNRPMLKRMKEVGFHYIAFGADAGNDRMLKIVKKGETIEQIESAVKNACELGYDVKLLFVVGTPYETRADVEDKVKIAQRYALNDVHFYNTIPYPGTELYDWVTKNDYFLIEPEVYLNNISCCESTPVFETPELPAAERVKLHRYLQKVRKDIHRRAFRRLYARFGFLSILSSYIFASDIFLKMFYQNFPIRRVIEKLRYRKAVSPGDRVRAA